MSFELIKQQNTEAIIRAIAQLDEVNYETVSQLIPALLARGEITLDASAYTPSNSETIDASGIGRHLIYDNPDKANPFSIWAFALAKRQKTSIHDHKYRGTVTVLQGPVSEISYIPNGDGSNLAKLHSCAKRHLFHTNSDNLDDKPPYTHQLKHCKDDGDDTIVTLHIYEMEAHRISNAGNMEDNRNLNKYYVKEKREESEKKEKRSYIPFYKEAPTNTHSTADEGSCSYNS